MALNWCDERYGTSVLCKQVSADSFEVNNLIKSSKDGFRVEYYIKPPVEVVFSFNKCNIEVKSIVIDTSVGIYQVEAMELFVSEKQQATEVVDFSNVAKCFSLKSSSVQFQNHRYRSRGIQSEGFATLQGAACIPLKNSFSLCNIGSLKIRILRMNSSGVPGLKRIEIWGQPARNTNDLVVKSLLDIKNKLESHQHGSANIYFPGKMTQTKKEQKFDEKLSNVDNSVPEDFLDSITYNIMTFPMLLPSGRSIDQTSLDKLYQSGRQPFDPFTGLPFTQQRRPIPNNSLKLRIDSYVTQNACNPVLSNIPRVLGDKIKLNSVNDMKQSRLVDIQNPIASSSGHKRPCQARKSPVCDKKLKTEPTSHQEVLKNSLNEALASILDKPECKTSTNQFTCGVCKLNSSNYSLPCKHVICRDCLVNLNFNRTEKCKECSVTFLRRDVTAIHVPRN